MPSQKVLEEKKQIVSELSEKFKSAVTCVFIDYSGINVTDDTVLRKEYRNAGVEYTIEKNTLIKLALKEAGIEGLDEILNGTTAVAIGKDATSAPKIAAEFGKKNEYYEIKGGFMDGKAIDVETVKALSEIPSKEVLIAKLLGSFKAPLSNFVYLLDAIAKKEA